MARRENRNEHQLPFITAVIFGHSKSGPKFLLCLEELGSPEQPGEPSIFPAGKYGWGICLLLGLFRFQAIRSVATKAPRRDAREMCLVSTCGWMSTAIGGAPVTPSLPAKWEMRLLVAGTFASVISKTPGGPQPGIWAAPCLTSSLWIRRLSMRGSHLHHPA